jgi:hypothetical protein
MDELLKALAKRSIYGAVLGEPMSHRSQQFRRQVMRKPQSCGDACMCSEHFRIDVDVGGATLFCLSRHRSKNNAPDFRGTPSDTTEQIMIECRHGSVLPQQLRQLGDVGDDAPGLVAGQQVRVICVPARCERQRRWAFLPPKKIAALPPPTYVRKLPPNEATAPAAFSTKDGRSLHKITTLSPDHPIMC